MRSVRPVAVALLLGAPLVGACSSASDQSPSGNQCKTVVSSIAASPVTGFVTLTGSFYTDETMQVTWFDNPDTKEGPHSFTATPPSARLVLDVGPYAAGQHSFYVFVSCHINGSNGSDDHGPFVVTVK